jgi:type II secretory pathway pseudopilin PulG
MWGIAMLRLVVVLLLIGLLLTVLLRGQSGDGQDGAQPYQDQVDKARQVEQQLQDSLQDRGRQMEDASD